MTGRVTAPYIRRGGVDAGVGPLRLCAPPAYKGLRRAQSPRRVGRGVFHYAPLRPTAPPRGPGGVERFHLRARAEHPALGAHLPPGTVNRRVGRAGSERGGLSNPRAFVSPFI